MTEKQKVDIEQARLEMEKTAYWNCILDYCSIHEEEYTHLIQGADVSNVGEMARLQKMLYFFRTLSRMPEEVEQYLSGLATGVEERKPRDRRRRRNSSFSLIGKT